MPEQIKQPIDDSHERYLESARKRSAERRANFTVEEREAYLEYQREYSKNNRATKNARRRLWRAERRLIEALGTADLGLIQKRRYQLALLDELINVPAAW